MKYILTKDTILLYPKETATGVKTIVYEKHRILEVDDSPKKIIRDNCLKHGSSFEGRKAHSRSLIKVHSKVPIVIKEDEKMIVFPLKSIRSRNCSWVCFCNYSLLKFLENGRYIVNSIRDDIVWLDTSESVISNQAQRSALLFCEYFR